MKAIEVLEKAISLLEHKDLDGFMALLSDDCVIMKDDGEVIARGTEQLHEFYTPIFGGQADLKIELGDQFSTGSVIAVREINHDLNVDGVMKEVDTVWIYKIINDKIAYMHVYSPDQASSDALDSISN
jgi:hypothetical protein